MTSHSIGRRVDTEQGRREVAEQLRKRLTEDVYEQTAATYLDMFERLLDGLDATPEQRARFPELAQQELQRLAGDDGPQAG